jgi:hypothetical protein
MIAHFLTVVTVAAFGAASTQAVADAPGFGDVIFGAWSDTAKCNRASARSASFDAVLKATDKLNGTCVAIEGFWAAHGLFERASHGNAKRSNTTR